MRYPIPPPAQTPPAEAVGRSLLLHAERALTERVNEHKSRFSDFWNSAATPAEITAWLASNGVRFLFDAQESVRHITYLACGPAIATMTQQEIQDALHAVLPPEYYVPRLPLVPNADGTVTVVPVEGLDAWGRPIPDPVEEQQAEEP
jgi:hypothetical protein